MNKCEKCGIQVPDGAKFCPKCGAPIAQKSQQPEAPTSAEKPAQQETKKPSDTSFIGKHFWVLFVSTGLLACLLLGVAEMYLFVSYGFAVTLAVLALISGICFCAVGLINKVSSAGKCVTRDNVCLAAGIIVALTVLLGAIALFAI